jgi:hypothetical protein
VGERKVLRVAEKRCYAKKKKKQKKKKKRCCCCWWKAIWIGDVSKSKPQSLKQYKIH